MAIKTHWDFKKHFYASPKDPKIGKDLKATERAYRTFAKKYRGRSDYLKNDAALAKALAEYEKLEADPRGARAILYFHYRQAIDSSDSEIESALNRISERLTKAGNEVIFFELALGKLDKKTRTKFLKSEKLAPYRYFLERIFEHSKHQLSEPEEKILSLKSLPAHAMWESGVEKAVSAKEVVFDGKTMPIMEARSKIASLPTKRRRELDAKVTEQFKEVGEFAESELNAVITNKKINDELRGFKNPYDATIMGYENDLQAVLNLVETVNKYMHIARRFYKVKAKMLGLTGLTHADRNAEVSKDKKKISYEKAATDLIEIFSSLNPNYGDIFRRMTANSQVDAFPKKGKRGGAFCSFTVGMPTFVFLNHTDDFRSFMTFAHEMGHAVHGERSKTQPTRYQHPPISTCEVASTFFEHYTFAKVMEKLSEKEQIIALHDHLQDEISTVFRQIAGFNFELDLHGRVRGQGGVSKEEIADLHNKHMSAYMGPVVKLKRDDGYFFVAWIHLRSFFYMYTYAYGHLASRAMLARYLEDTNYLEKIDHFLSAGNCKMVEDIFADIGIDTRNKKFFEEGLKAIERDVAKLERLVAKKK